MTRGVGSVFGNRGGQVTALPIYGTSSQDRPRQKLGSGGQEQEVLVSKTGVNRFEFFVHDR